jgi:hypothetical protein
VEGIRRAIVKASTASGAEVQDRALDAAIPSGVAVGRSTEMLAQIRRIASEGLKAVLRIEEAHDASEQDVQSRPFRMEFVLDAAGRFEPRVLSVRVESNDFDVAERIKQLRVPPDGDSEPCAFLVTPRRAGELALIVEVLHEGISVASRMLRTKGQEAAKPAMATTYVLASLPLTTYGFGSAVTAARDPSPAVRVAAPPAATDFFEHDTPQAPSPSPRPQLEGVSASSIRRAFHKHARSRGRFVFFLLLLVFAALVLVCGSILYFVKR